jgi:hypothetical protein
VKDTVRGAANPTDVTLELIHKDYRGNHLWRVRNAQTNEQLGDLSRPKTETEDQVRDMARNFYKAEIEGKRFPVHRVEITDAMRGEIKTKGQPLFSPDVTKSENFKAWFGDSKVVDEAGKPKVVYHGTNRNFNRFSKETAGKASPYDPGLIGPAFYFTPTKEQAGHFAEGAQYRDVRHGHAKEEEGARVMPVYLSLKNPLVVEDGKLPDGRTLSQVHRTGISAEGGKDLQRMIKSRGHDGAIFKTGGEEVQYVVFEPTQIKSQFNQGSFDPKVADVRFSPDADRMKVLEGGKKVSLKDLDQITPDEWEKINKFMIRAGYDYRGAGDAKEMFSQDYHKQESGEWLYDKKQAEALMYALKGKAPKEEPVKRAGVMFAKAAKRFPPTDDAALAGYMLPDGRMLDMSGGSGQRAHDHREIADLVADSKRDERGEAMRKFVRAGAIRLFPEMPGLDMSKKPTDAQMNKLRDWVASFGQENIVIDFESNVAKAFREYPPAAHRRIFTDIKRFYEDGELPEMPDYLGFRDEGFDRSERY